MPDLFPKSDSTFKTFAERLEVTAWDEERLISFKDELDATVTRTVAIVWIKVMNEMLDSLNEVAHSGKTKRSIGFERDHD
jgi:hypothetical protein